VRDALRLLLPRPHELGPVAPGVGHGLFCTCPCGPGCRRVECARERIGARGLHGIDRRQGVHQAKPAGGRTSPDDRARQRAAAHLDHDRIQRAGLKPAFGLLRASGRNLLDHLPGERLAALDGQSVVAPLAAERQGTVAQRGLERQVAGISREAGLPVAGRDPGAEGLQAAENRRVRGRRHEHVKRPACGTRHHGGREGRVAAAGDGQGSAVFEGSRPLGNEQVEHHAHQVACLVRARDVHRLVLHPQHASCLEAQAGREPFVRSERRRFKARSVHVCDRTVQAKRELPVLAVAQAARHGKTPRRKQGFVAGEGVGPVERAGSLRPAGVVEWYGHEHVVDVVTIACNRAAERACHGPHHRAATRAPKRRPCHPILHSALRPRPSTLNSRRRPLFSR